MRLHPELVAIDRLSGSLDQATSVIRPGSFSSTAGRARHEYLRGVSQRCRGWPRQLPVAGPLSPGVESRQLGPAVAGSLRMTDRRADRELEQEMASTPRPRTSDESQAAMQQNAG